MMNRFQAINPEMLGLQAGDRVLDVGCGVGRHLLELSRCPGLYIGLDSARLDLRKGHYWFLLMQRKGEVQGSVNFVEGDAPRLPFVDGSFDRVVCTEVLEHVPNDGEVLAELVRVLRPGGVLAISVPDEPAERLFWSVSWQYRNYPGGHVRIYRRQDLPRMLKKGGVRLFAVDFRHSLETLYWLFRILDTRDITREGPLSRRLSRFFGSISPRLTPVLDTFDALGNYIVPKSIVLYGRKLERTAS